MTRKALVCGAGGFIGSHLVKRLKAEGYWVRGVDLKRPEFSPSAADDFVVGDLRKVGTWDKVLDQRFDEAYQFAADMGGAGFVFTGENDAEIMHNSAMINLHMADFGVTRKVKQVFYSSSACIYPAYNQEDPDKPNCKEATAYPAAPDSAYGWEKLFSERLYFSFCRNRGLNVRVARFHNIFAPKAPGRGTRESARRALPKDRGATRGRGNRALGRRRADPLLLIYRRMHRGSAPPYAAPHISRPGQHRIRRDGDHQSDGHHDHGDRRQEGRHQARSGTAGGSRRNSDNALIRRELGWAPSASLKDGLAKTYAWIAAEVYAPAGEQAEAMVAR